MKLLKTESLIDYETGDQEVLELWEYNPVDSGWDYIDPENPDMTDYTERQHILELFRVAIDNGIQPRDKRDYTGWLEYSYQDIFNLDHATIFTLFPSNSSYPDQEQELKLIEGIFNLLLAGYDLDELDK